MNYEDIVFKFLSENQNDDYIGAICYGSYVKNQADTLSDIDLMIFTKNDNAYTLVLILKKVLELSILYII